MKAAAFTRTGSPDVIRMMILPDPNPGPDEVVILTKAIGLNFADINRRKGIYPVTAPSPYVLGYEGAGIVVATRSAQFTVGDRVAFAHVPRANAELVLAPAWKVIPLPSTISFETAAGILLQGLTAHYLAHNSYAIRQGDRVLVHAASGGVGLLLLQIAKILGATTIGTVSSKHKIALAKDAGAKQVLIRTEAWKSRVTPAVDVAYDAIGATLLDSLEVTKAQGTVVYYGQAGGIPPAIDPNLLMHDSKRLVGGELWSHVATREALLVRARQLFTWIEQGQLRPAPVTRYPLAETALAHRALESGTTQGKILLMTEE